MTITSLDQYLFGGAADGTVFPEENDVPLPLKLTATVYLDDDDTELLCGCPIGNEVIVRTVYRLDWVRSHEQGRWVYTVDEDQSAANEEDD